MDENVYRASIVTNDYCEYEKEWNDLFQRSNKAAPYLSFPWINTFIRYKRVSGSICIITVRNDEKLVSLWPLSIRKTLGARIAEPIGTGIPSYLGVLIDPEHMSALHTIVAYCKTSPGIFDAYKMSDLPATDEATNMLLGELVHGGFWLKKSQRNPCYYIQLDNSFEDYLNKYHSKNHRKIMRRSIKQLYSTYDVQIKRYVGDEITKDMYDRIAVIQEKSWMKRRFASDLVDEFHHFLLVEMARNNLCQLWIMTLNGEDAAFRICISHGENIYLHRTAFNLKFEGKMSIGNILLSHVIEDVYTDNTKLIDFGHGYGQHKKIWSTNHYFVYRAITGRNIKGRIVVLFHAIIWKIAEITWIKSKYKYIKFQIKRVWTKRI